MGVIQKLHKSGMVAVVIIVALVLFVLGDFWFKRSGRDGMEERDVIGEVFGEPIREADLNAVFAELVKQESQKPDFKDDEETRKKLIDQAWTTLISRKSFEAQVGKSGLEVSDEEFNELVGGEYPLADLTGVPDFQTDGKYDKKKVEMLFKRAKTDATLREGLASFVAQVKKQQLERKYATYIAKAQVVSKIERQYDYSRDNNGAKGKLIAVNYSTIPDKDVKITEADLEKYLEAHKEEYKQTFESRDIKYVVWDLIPSAEDTLNTKKQAERFYESWKKEDKPDTTGEFVVAFTPLRELGSDSTEKAMYSSLAALPVNGMLPMMNFKGKITIVQKLDQRWDSAGPFVKVEHILIPYGGELPNKMKITDTANALAVANEVMAKVKAGAKISELGKDYSTDPGFTGNKGLYDWAKSSSYVPEFGAYCASHKKGDIDVVGTQFGFHIIRVLENPDGTQIKLRRRQIEVEPGSQTIKLATEQSRRFRNRVQDGDPKSFEKAGTAMRLEPRVKAGIRTEDRSLPGIDQREDVKNLLQWLFDKDRKTNDVSDVFAFSRRQMVVLVTSARHRGYSTVNDVKEKIEPLVRNELKAEKIREKLKTAMAGGKTPEEIAQKAGGNVVPLDNVKMGTNFIPQLFTEHRILGAVFGIKEKTWSAPVAGNQVVVVIWVDSKDKVEVPKTFEVDARMAGYLSDPQYVTQQLKEVIRLKAEVQDYRFKFNWD